MGQYPYSLSLNRINKTPLKEANFGLVHMTYLLTTESLALEKQQ